jgi:hypothetical protein
MVVHAFHTRPANSWIVQPLSPVDLTMTVATSRAETILPATLERAACQPLQMPHWRMPRSINRCFSSFCMSSFGITVWRHRLVNSRPVIICSQAKQQTRPRKPPIPTHPLTSGHQRNPGKPPTHPPTSPQEPGPGPFASLLLEGIRNSEDLLLHLLLHLLPRVPRGPRSAQ